MERVKRNIYCVCVAVQCYPLPLKWWLCRQAIFPRRPLVTKLNWPSSLYSIRTPFKSIVLRICFVIIVCFAVVYSLFRYYYCSYLHTGNILHVIYNNIRRHGLSRFKMPRQTNGEHWSLCIPGPIGADFAFHINLVLKQYTDSI